jgi:hypothetical protein
MEIASHQQRYFSDLVKFIKSRRSTALLIIAFFISAVFSMLRWDIMQVGGSVDDAQYVVLAESLASGQGYRLINFPEPSENVSFPPGWPLLLSIFTAAFPGNFTVLKMVSFLMWLAAIPLTYRLFSSRLRSPYLELLTLLVATNALLVASSTMLMAEAAYIFFSLLTLNLFDYWFKHSGNAPIWLAPAVAFAAVYTQLIRSIGISLVLALLFFLLLNRRIRQFFIMSGFVVIGLLPQIFLFSGREGGLFSGHYQALTISNSLIDYVSRAAEQAVSYSNLLISDAIIPIFRPTVIAVAQNIGLGFFITLINILILSLLLIGFLCSIRKTKIWDIYIVIYFGGILVFRDPNMGVVQPRFLIPLIPFFLYYLVLGSTWLLYRLPLLKANYVRHVMVMFGLLIIFVSVLDNFQSWRNPTHLRTTDLTSGTTFIRQETPLDAVVMTRDPIPRYLYARRATVAYPEKGQNIDTYIHENGINYLMIAPLLKTPADNKLDQYTELELIPHLTTHRERFKIVFTDFENNVRVYEVVQ